MCVCVCIYIYIYCDIYIYISPFQDAELYIYNLQNIAAVKMAGLAGLVSQMSICATRNATLTRVTAVTQSALRNVVSEPIVMHPAIRKKQQISD
jgi:hypothetical protein